MDFIEQLKSSVDIVQVVGERVRLRRVGAGPRYTGLCPFHTEKTPSFSVHSQHQYYKCFGCGEGGDVIKFVMEMDRLTFWEAVKWLAERWGIPLPKRSEAADEETKQRGSLYEMHEIAMAHFRENLFSPAGQEAREYLARRGVKKETAEEFGLGLSSREWGTLTRILERRGFTGEDLESSGLALRRNDGNGFYDRFRGRLMFPIHAENGKTIAFGGRALGADDEPKYLNSAETPIYRKSYVLYNLNRAKKAIQDAGASVLVEGYMDVIGVYAAGVHNVVATCGTALTAFQVRSLRRHAPNIVVNFDPDNAGAQATWRSLTVLLTEKMDVSVLPLEGGLDPDEFIKTRGTAEYEQALGRAPRFFNWHAEQTLARLGPKTQEGKARALQEALPLIQLVDDKHVRIAIAHEYAAYFGVDRGMLLDDFKKAAGERRDPPSRKQEYSMPEPNEVALLHALLTNGEARAEVAPMLAGKEWVARFKMARVFEVLLKQIESGGAVTVNTVEARLGEADREMLHRVLFNEELVAGGVTVEQAVACVRKLEGTEREVQRDELRHRIKAAEKAGDLEEALRLTAELQTLGRS